MLPYINYQYPINICKYPIILPFKGKYPIPQKAYMLI